MAEVEAIFDVVLERFEGRFLGALPLIDLLLQKAQPTDADVKALRGRVPNNLITFEYFFSRVEAPEWLDLLASESFFTRPPDPVRDDDKGMIRFPPWPESRYLARMAAKPGLQGRVVEIALTIADTANINVHEDLVRVALAVPPAFAARIAPRLRQWLRLPYQLRLLHRIGDLVTHLAAGGETGAALDLASAFLTIVPDQDAKEVSVGDKTWRLPPHPRTAHDEWLVEEFLKEKFPLLIDAAGTRALIVVCKALDDAVALSRSRPDDESPQDYSTIWRPAIDDHEGNLGNELKSTLVSAVRRSAERLIEREPARTEEVVTILESHRWAVFKRIALHLLQGAPVTALPLVEDRLAQRERFGDRSQKREYVLLAQAWFTRLSVETQQKLVGWIEKGPDLEAVKQVPAEMGGQPPSDEELAEYADRWRLENLRALRDVLPAESRDRYDRLVERYGEPETPDFFSFRTRSEFRGPKSLITAAELRQTPIADLIPRLKAWEPSDEFLGPSPEGLSRALAAAVKEDPARFAADAERFSELEPTYVRGLITGLRDALAKERVFDWGPVLKLCRWAVEQPREPDDGGSPWERDRSWRWTRNAIVDLLEQGLKTGSGEIPFALRDLGWSVLRPITDDPDPGPKDPADPPDSEPLATAVNTTRGRAMEALVRYALWVKEHIARSNDASLKDEIGLKHMPEVRAVLDEHLDPTRDPAPAIRSIYGRWLPSLIYSDREWVTQNLARILPTGAELARFRDAAWDTYVVSCPVYNDAADILKDEYRRAAERIGQMQRAARSPADPADHLAEHLTVLYWRGKIDLGGPELAHFYSQAPDDVRAHAMWFVGRVFAKGEEPPSEMVDRLKLMFETRLAAAQGTPEDHRKELEHFGSWFASGRFGAEWSLTKLQETLRLVSSSEPDSLVMDQLVKWAPAHPQAVLDCVRLMVEGASEYWKIEAWRDEIREIVRVARQANGQAREAAATLVNILGARGHLDFRDLLSD